MNAFLYVFSIILVGTASVCCVAMLYERCMKHQALHACQELTTYSNHLRDECEDLHIEIANRDGVSAGHQADTMYRGLLQQFETGEQVTIMYQNPQKVYYSGSR